MTLLVGTNKVLKNKRKFTKVRILNKLVEKKRKKNRACRMVSHQTRKVVLHYLMFSMKAVLLRFDFVRICGTYVIIVFLASGAGDNLGSGNTAQPNRSRTISRMY